MLCVINSSISFWMSPEIHLWPVLFSHAASPGTSASCSSNSCFKFPSSSSCPHSARPWKAKMRMDDDIAIRALRLSFIWFCLDSERADATFSPMFKAVRAAEAARCSAEFSWLLNLCKAFFQFWKPVPTKAISESLSRDVRGSGSFLSVARTQMSQYTLLVCAL